MTVLIVTIALILCSIITAASLMRCRACGKWHDDEAEAQSCATMKPRINTVTTTTGKMDVIHDQEKVQRLLDAAEHLASRLRLWTDTDGEMLCSEDAAALAEWDALASNRQSLRQQSTTEQNKTISRLLGGKTWRQK